MRVTGTGRVTASVIFWVAVLVSGMHLASAYWLTDSVENGLRDVAHRAMRFGSHAANVVRSAVKRSTGSRNEDAPGIGTRCVLDREPDMSHPPTLYFFSYKQYSQQSLGCAGETASFHLNGSEPQDRDNRRAAIDRELIQSGAYDPESVTYVFTHGFMADWKSDPWMCEEKDRILNHSNANVFILDWSSGANPALAIDYGAAVANTRRVAELVADYLKDLLERTHGSPSQLHLVGHSLGAHISGFVGYQLGESSVGRITALDPAGPCFGANEEATAASSGVLDRTERARGRLSAASAKLVVALHTDVNMFGLNENCAHYDVYVNGGSNQPGCFELQPGKVLVQAISSQVDKSPGCGHTFSHQIIDNLYGAETATSAPSDNKCKPMAYACDSWELFQKGACGFCLDNDDRCTYAGLYLGTASEQMSQVSRAVIGETRHYIATGASEPHCLYQYQVMVATNRGTGWGKPRFDLLISWNDQERVVRVEHELAPAGELQLGSRFLDAMRQHHKSSLGKLKADNGTKLYTALLTFESQSTSNSCNESYDSLCYPLGPLKGAHLLANSQKQLEAVDWVALNFMSAVNQTERLGQSHVFAVDRTDEGSATGDASKLATSSTIRMNYYAKLKSIP